MGFDARFIGWIKVCITTASFAILVNGNHSQVFSSARGLRQGDPLSPLLFVITMEGLTSLMDYAKVEGAIIGLGEKNFGLNHLLFTDDVILFAKAKPNSIRNIELVLTKFSKASGLKINVGRSKVFFSKSVPKVIMRSSIFKEGTLLVKYLGIPLHHKKLHIAHFQPMIDKVRKKLNYFVISTLSQAGRVEMLKMVVYPQIFY